MPKKKYRRYSPEFKRHALKRASEDGHTDKEVCEDLGISARQLRRWRDQYRLLGDQAFPGQGKRRDEEIAELKRKLAKAEQERDFSRDAAVFFARSRNEIHLYRSAPQTISGEDDVPGTKVSRSGYYAWRSRPESQRAKTDRQLTREIRRIHIDSDGVYGAPKITAELKEEGHQCGKHKVARLMRIAGLKGCPKPTFKVTTQRDPSHPVADNLLEQDFTAEGPNERWASDITYIATHQGWLFVAVVLDLYSRRIVGWSMGRWINRQLVIDALNMAIGQRCPDGELLHHSDSELPVHELCVRQAMPGGKGLAVDGFSRRRLRYAMAESFFATLEREVIDRRTFRSQAEARMAIFTWLEGWYNPHRRHSSLSYLSPINYERKMLLRAA